MDARVIAVREHKLVGRGSCTTIDECLTNKELLWIFTEENVETPDAAVVWCLEAEGMEREQALNARWGEDDDPQLLAWQDWQKKVTIEKES